jgi:hypothetical protein
MLIEGRHHVVKETDKGQKNGHKALHYENDLNACGLM